MTATHTFAEGDEVRIIAGPGTDLGKVGILHDINPNPHWAEDDETWADLKDSVDGSSSLAEILGPQHVELVRAAADVPAKRVPSAQEILRFMGSALLDEQDGIRVDETDHNGETDAIEFYGTSATNKRFAVRVKIETIEGTDY